uniref:Uncharacterized protein n=1 Tax=Romanomermis culicivorax TaxID=13658 RepID=A0A915I110_ROMCU
MQWEFEEGMSKMKAKIHKMEYDYGFLKEEDATHIVEQKGMVPPSPMKVDDNIDIDKLIINEDAKIGGQTDHFDLYICEVNAQIEHPPGHYWIFSQQRER